MSETQICLLSSKEVVLLYSWVNTDVNDNHWSNAMIGCKSQLLHFLQFLLFLPIWWSPSFLTQSDSTLLPHRALSSIWLLFYFPLDVLTCILPNQKHTLQISFSHFKACLHVFLLSVCLNHPSSPKLCDSKQRNHSFVLFQLECVIG